MGMGPFEWLAAYTFNLIPSHYPTAIQKFGRLTKKGTDPPLREETCVLQALDPDIETLRECSQVALSEAANVPMCDEGVILM